MTHTTLISPHACFPHLDDPAWAFVDCRFTLADPEGGRRAYAEAHLPGAVYAHLDEDLSSPHRPGLSGRHPLPPVERLVERLSDWGIDAEVQVVAYDDTGGAIGAARLWWLLRWLGHTPVAVLDGGWQAWVREGLPVRGGSESRRRRPFIPKLRPEMVAEVDEVALRRNDPAYRLLDARAAERFRGQNETIDPVAGHIPGAISAPYAANLDPASGCFRPAPELRALYQRLLSGALARQVIAYCGSGVSAAHTVLAIEHAGLGEARLYPGSWSEWITDPARPIG
jgi:thiosulfate/3-mercaptopyruvate sulfurtransferase